jgi:hypothetical protein
MSLRGSAISLRAGTVRPVDAGRLGASPRRRCSVRAEILRNVTQVWRSNPPMAPRHSYACIGRYAAQQPPRRITLL